MDGVKNLLASLYKILTYSKEFYGDSWLNMACNAAVISATCIALTLTIHELLAYELAASLVSWLGFAYLGLDLALSGIFNPFSGFFEGEYIDCKGAVSN